MHVLRGGSDIFNHAVHDLIVSFAIYISVAVVDGVIWASRYTCLDAIRHFCFIRWPLLRLLL